MKSKKKEKTELNEIRSEVNNFFQQILPYLIASFSVLIIFFVTVDAFEYLTTEYWWIQDSINYKYTTIFLFILIGLISIFDWQKIINNEKLLKILISVLFSITIFFHRQYSLYYSELQRHPKIKKISKDWGLAGSWVKIEGRNFGEVYEEGKVYLGDEEMIIKKWTNKEIIFEIPIRDIKGSFDIRVENKYEKIQDEEVRFELR
jgi:hypothetical protein